MKKSEVKDKYKKKYKKKLKKALKELESKPWWIGLEFPTPNGFTNVLIGINMEDGNSAEFCTETDIESGKNQSHSPWVSYNTVINATTGVNSIVFDRDNRIIIKK